MLFGHFWLIFIAIRCATGFHTPILSTPVKVRGSVLSYAEENSQPETRSTLEVVELTSQGEYLDFLARCAANDELAVVKFYAEWCKSCQAFSRKFDRLSSVNGAKQIRFASLEFGKQPKLCRSLGITHLPAVQFYDGPKGKIDGFSCSPKNFGKVKDAVKDHLSSRWGEEDEVD